MQEVPAGTIISYVGTEDSLNKLLKTGNWLLCDGQSYPTNGTYSALYKAIGFGFGGSQEKNTFCVPDLRGMLLRGVNGNAQNSNGTATRDPDAATRTAQPNSGGMNNGNTGNMVGSWQTDALASHQHNWDHFFYYFFPSPLSRDIACHQPPDSPDLQTNTRQATNHDGGVKTGSQGLETRPKNVYVYYLICCVN
jgi:hypothetical protein